MKLYKTKKKWSEIVNNKINSNKNVNKENCCKKDRYFWIKEIKQVFELLRLKRKQGLSLKIRQGKVFEGLSLKSSTMRVINVVTCKVENRFVNHQTSKVY